MISNVDYLYRMFYVKKLMIKILKSFFIELEAIYIEKRQSFNDRVNFVEQKGCQYDSALDLEENC